jgi:hypothetical protein
MGVDFSGLTGLNFQQYAAFLDSLLTAILAELLFDDQDEHHQIYQEQQQLVSVALLLKKQPIQNTHFETNLTLGFWDVRFIIAISVEALTLLDI